MTTTPNPTKELTPEQLNETLTRIWFTIDETITCANYERYGQTLLDLYTDNELMEHPELLQLRNGYIFNDADEYRDIYDDLYHKGEMGFVYPEGNGFIHYYAPWCNYLLKETDNGIDFDKVEGYFKLG